MKWQEKKRHPLFRRWTHIRQTILNPNCPDYREGLTCDALDDFTEFVEMVEQECGTQPSQDHKLNRINQDLGWIRGNLRWAQPKEVSRNIKRQIKTVEYKGQSVCLTELAEMSGIVYGTVCSRRKRGWTAEQIAENPPLLGRRIINPEYKRRTK